MVLSATYIKLWRSRKKYGTTRLLVATNKCHYSKVPRFDHGSTMVRPWFLGPGKCYITRFIKLTFNCISTEDLLVLLRNVDRAHFFTNLIC